MRLVVLNVKKVLVLLKVMLILLLVGKVDWSRVNVFLGMMKEVEILLVILVKVYLISLCVLVVIKVSLLKLIWKYMLVMVGLSLLFEVVNSVFVIFCVKVGVWILIVLIELGFGILGKFFLFLLVSWYLLYVEVILILKFLLLIEKVIGCWGKVFKVFSRILVGIVMDLFVFDIILIFVEMEVLRLVVVIFNLLLLIENRKFFKIGRIGLEVMVFLIICNCLSNLEEEMLNFIFVFGFCEC